MTTTAKELLIYINTLTNTYNCMREVVKHAEKTADCTMMLRDETTNPAFSAASTVETHIRNKLFQIYPDCLTLSQKEQDDHILMRRIKEKISAIEYDIKSYAKLAEEVVANPVIKEEW